MKLMKNLFVLALSIVVLASCNDDDNNTNTSRVKVALKTTQAALKNGSTPANEPLVLDVFKISIGEIEFDVDDDMEDLIPGGDSIYSDIELEGPFLVDLLDPKAETGIDLATANIPNAVYEEIEFDFEPYNLDEPKEMTGNTILASGTFEGTPFTIISQEELELELEYANGYKLDGADSRLFIDLNLAQLKTLVAAIDFSQATPEADGSILITKDKNANILEKFEEAVENSFDVEEEGDDDDDDE